MSAGNWFETRRSAYELRSKAVTAAYTVRLGGTAYNFIEDRVITITNPAALFTITVPDGIYEGQRLLVTYLSNSSSVTVTVSTGTELRVFSLTTAGDYCSLEWINSIVGWKALSSQESI